MRAGAWIPRGVKRSLGQEAGFTLIELMAAMVVTVVGVAALIATLDSSRELITFSESKEAAIHVGEKELERIQSLDYSDTELPDTPVPCNGGLVDQVCDFNNPAKYVTQNGEWYRWDQRPWREVCSETGDPIEHCERLVIDDTTLDNDPVGQVSNIREAFPVDGPNGVRLEVEMQRFITAVDDDCVSTLTTPAIGPCTGAEDYRRITVAVRILRATTAQREQLMNGGPGRPILLSTVVRPAPVAP